jgi:hypothetical protein
MTSTEARDEMLGMLNTYWRANAGAAIGTPQSPPPILWEGSEPGAPPDQAAGWARVTVLHATGQQATLANDVGCRRFRRDGTIIVQCFAPRGKRGLTLAEALATVAKDAFEGKHSPNGEAWFSNATIHEVGPDKGWFQVNASIQFQYDEVK